MTASQPPQHTTAPDPAVTTAGPPPGQAGRPLKQTERPHPLTPFVRGWLIFVAIAIGWGREIVVSTGEDQFDAGGLTLILPIFGIVVVLAAVTGFVA
jgi:putative membrane protein